MTGTASPFAGVRLEAHGCAGLRDAGTVKSFYCAVVYSETGFNPLDPLEAREDGEGSEIAAELVRRWNAHEGMLSALQRLVDAVDAESDGAAGPGVQFPAELKATIEQARAALRSALEATKGQS